MPGITNLRNPTIECPHEKRVVYVLSHSDLPVAVKEGRMPMTPAEVLKGFTESVEAIAAMIPDHHNMEYLAWIKANQQRVLHLICGVMGAV
jgi:hypothetical protein